MAHTPNETLEAIANHLEEHLRPAGYTAYISHERTDHIRAGSQNPNITTILYIYLEGTHLHYSYPLNPSYPNTLTINRDYDIEQPGSLDHLHLHILQALDNLYNN